MVSSLVDSVSPAVSDGQIDQNSDDKVKESECNSLNQKEVSGFQRIFWPESIISISIFIIYMWIFFSYHDRVEVIALSTAIVSLALLSFFTAEEHQLWSRSLRTSDANKEIRGEPQYHANSPVTICEGPSALDYIMWPETTWWAITCVSTFYGLYSVAPYIRWQTWIFGFALSLMGGIGVSAGLHRLWGHRSYKAKMPLQVILMIFASSLPLDRIETWTRNHRMHHRYSDTDADPHNPSRGFFYSHIGWMLSKPHPLYLSKLDTVHMTDLLNNPVVQFHNRYYHHMWIIFAVVLPTLIPYSLWNEGLAHAFIFCFIMKTSLVVNLLFLVNSVCHLYGYRPYDKSLRPAQVPGLGMLMTGENQHNYHHAFPWDYSVNEIPNASNFSKTFIDLMGKIGWAYDMKKATPGEIESRKERTGDKEERAYCYGH